MDRVSDPNKEYGSESRSTQRRLVAKVFEPAGAALRPDAADQETDAGAAGANARLIDRFRAAAETQKTVADDIESFHWAAIYDADTFPGGAFYVTDFVEYSCSDLLATAGRGGPGAPEELFAICHGVVQGLLELDRRLQRPHGNIKPGNILLERNERDPRNPWIVMMTDPASDAELQSSGKRTDDDLNELGKLLYQLVEGTEWRHRPGTDPPPTKAWKQLGRKGEQWRVLCRDLLTLSPPTLRETAKRLEELRPRRDLGMPIAVGCSVMLLAVVGWVAYAQLVAPPKQAVSHNDQQQNEVQPPEPPPGPSVDKVAETFNTRAAWFAALVGDDREQVNQILDYFDLSTNIGSRIETLDSEIREVDVENIDALTALSSDIEALRTDLIERIVSKKPSDDLRWRRAHAEFEEMYRRIGGLRALDAVTGRQLRNRLVTLHQSSQRRDEAVEVWDIELKPQLERLERWAKDYGESIISALSATVDRDMANVALDDLVTHLAGWSDLTEQLAEATGRWDRIDVEYLRDSEWYKSTNRARQIQRDHLTRWRDAVAGGDYDLLADGDNQLPAFDRWLEGKEQQITSDRERLAGLLDRAGPDDREMPPAPDLDTPRAALPPWDGTRRTRDHLEREIASIKQIAEGSRNDLEARITGIIGNECDLLAQTLRAGLPVLPDAIADHTTSLNEAWQRIEDARAEGDQCAVLREQAVELQRVADRIREDVVLPAGAPPPDQMPERMSHRDIDEFLNSKWQREVGEALEAIDPSDSPQWDQLIESGRNYQSWVNEVRDVLADYAHIERQLLAAHHLRDIEDNYRGCADSEVVRELCRKFDRINQLADAVEKLRQIDQLAIASIGDGQRLVQKIGDPDQSTMPVHRWAAWQKLGEPTATSMRSFLDWEDDAKTHIETALSDIARINRDRGESLQDKFRQQRQSRWLTNAAAAHQTDWLNDAFDRMADFNVERRDLSGHLAFNYEMRTLLEAVRQYDPDAAGEPELRRDIKERARTALELLEEEELDEAEQWRQVLTDITAFELVDREPDWANAGPAAAGWRRNPADDDGAEVMRFTPPQEWREEHGELLDNLLGEHFEVAFRRVATNDGAGAPTTYLSTSEVSAGLFLAIVRILNNESILREELLHHNPRGARLWNWQNGRMEFTREWLENQSAVNRHPAFFLPEPGASFPMQNVTPAAALGVAQLLGCRLPTEAEWLEAARTATEHENLVAYLRAERIDELIAITEQHNKEQPGNTVGRVNDRSTRDVFRGHLCEKDDDAIPLILERTDGRNSDWFHPVDMGAAEFENLIGNVAEFVLSDRFDRHKEPQVPDAFDEPAEFVEWLREFAVPDGAHGEIHLRIIGGSIFWPSEHRLFCSLPYHHTPRPRDPIPDLADPSTDVHRQVYPDVGFRLAFDSPVGKSGREQFQRLVQQVAQWEQPYLLAARP